MSAVEIESHRVTSEEQLRSLYPEPTENSRHKQIDHLDRHCRDLVARSPLVLVATAGADGACDVSPRGGPPGWVTVLDDHRLALPDLPGNRRLDSMANLVRNPNAGLLFVVPGREETLRVNGPAVISTDPELIDATMVAQGRRPATVVVVEAREVFIHCAKAFKRGAIWDPASWPQLDGLASPAQMLRDHTDNGRTVDEVQASIDESYTERLW
jgi:PPOX class probable FMN-dependent enzyme